jgi:hypothetical protein
MNVVELPSRDPKDRTVSDVLREMARMIDAGHLSARCAMVVFVDDAGRIGPYAIGRTTEYEGAGILMAAAQAILNARFAEIGGPSPAPTTPQRPEQ